MSANVGEPPAACRRYGEGPAVHLSSAPVSLERNFDETFVARLAASEKQVQQSYRPIIGVHKWFARRPGTLFRALMLAELSHEPLAKSFFEHSDLDGIVLDPFMGGGTTLFEANRLGLSVIGFDTNPMSRWICERELEEIDLEKFEETGEQVCRAVEKQVGALYVTKCDECDGEASVKSFLWVKAHQCTCGYETLLFPGPHVAGRGMKRHTHEVMVCGKCRAVAQFLPDTIPDNCPDCDASYAETKIGSTGTCQCGKDFSVPAKRPSAPPKHVLFALEYHCPTCKTRKGRRGRFFKGATAKDHGRYADAVSRLSEINSDYIPETQIPDGDETRRLHRWGYSKFRELHNDRQLLGLSILAEEINRQPEDVRPALATVFSDFIRYQNMVCRYDTAALKILDVFSIHGFPVHRVQCEAALIGLPRIGSGGYRHFLRKYAAAKRYCKAPFETMRDDGKKRRIEIEGESIAANFVDSPSALRGGNQAVLRCASLADEPLKEGSVDLVLTDPPYYAMVQYSELMDFCYAWLRQLVPGVQFFLKRSAKSDSEVTGNQTQGRALDGFAEGLSGVYRAATQALKPGAPFAFTYHHNTLESYAAIVVACLDSGLVPITTMPCPSEMRGSIHISKTGSSRVDTVFVLRKPPVAMPAQATASIDLLVEEELRHLLDADLAVTSGDQRCLRYGLIAEAAMRQLAGDWEREAPIRQRLGLATDALVELDASPKVSAGGKLIKDEQRRPAIIESVA
jgi:putative DNA methylase